MEEFRDTIGDVQLPSMSYWLIKKDEPSSIYMIWWIWILWVSNVLFMCVILLNLLISIMGASYESATSDNFALKY